MKREPLTSTLPTCGSSTTFSIASSAAGSSAAGKKPAGKTVSQSFEIAAGEKIDLGYNEQPGIAMDQVAVPGSMVSIYLETAGSGSNELLVPALNGDLAEWSEIVNAL